MFYEFLDFLLTIDSGFNVVRYITFRSAFAAITALLVSFIVGPLVIKALGKNQIKEEIRKDGPETHFVKAGTPTMGGIIVLISVVVPMLLWGNLRNGFVLMILFGTIWMGVIGLADDYIKVVKKDKSGLQEKTKLFGQISIGILVGCFLYFFPALPSEATTIAIPFAKSYTIDIGYFYIPFVVFVVAGTTNAVNLSDGLDGLAIGLSGICFLTFAGIAYVSGHINFSQYLNINFIPGSGELTVFCAAIVGASLGFLWYNTHPAQIFMGDTGSLALGGALGILAVLLKKELYLLILGGVFVGETLSVIIQRRYFKYTKKKYGEGRRVFKMAPIHHHFEKEGWHEAKIVIRFWIIGVLFALLTLSTFKIR
ncbi:MAG: phospho-N-acetylmuramoyl-pentapeptide-transferase [Calditrichaeota bacterium]|nr:MAG: phospho-N-acetylmuramoyl-pentapeptide-transferase [Calditrichota bacterium]